MTDAERIQALDAERTGYRLKYEAEKKRAEDAELREVDLRERLLSETPTDTDNSWRTGNPWSSGYYLVAWRPWSESGAAVTTEAWFNGASVGKWYCWRGYLPGKWTEGGDVPPGNRSIPLDRILGWRFKPTYGHPRQEVNVPTLLEELAELRKERDQLRRDRGEECRRISDDT